VTAAGGASRVHPARPARRRGRCARAGEQGQRRPAAAVGGRGRARERARRGPRCSARWRRVCACARVCARAAARARGRERGAFLCVGSARGGALALRDPPPSPPKPSRRRCQKLPPVGRALLNPEPASAAGAPRPWQWGGGGRPAAFGALAAGRPRAATA